MSLHSRTFGDFSRETRERRLLNIRRQIHGGTYDIAARLDATVEAMLDREGFTSHPPVMRPDDANLDELMNDEWQRMTETDA